jgi:hypothetical protein
MGTEEREDFAVKHVLKPNTRLYCPRCDKRLTPDHKCLSRRFFLGMLGTAMGVVAAPSAVLFPVVDCGIDDGTAYQICSVDLTMGTLFIEQLMTRSEVLERWPNIDRSLLA